VARSPLVANGSEGPSQYGWGTEGSGGYKWLAQTARHSHRSPQTNFLSQIICGCTNVRMGSLRGHVNGINDIFLKYSREDNDHDKLNRSELRNLFKAEMPELKAGELDSLVDMIMEMEAADDKQVDRTEFFLIASCLILGKAPKQCCKKK
ncbi:hypothetical protein scyTo_0022573, partial [Scyliorhinus torazame]|nr:hypothetical protein [Scyliorhinus torazame]